MTSPASADPCSLASFIRTDIEFILDEWDAFARRLFAGYAIVPNDLRDHAREMLMAISEDMARPQSDAAQTDKANGLIGEVPSKIALAAAEHATSRVIQHFTLPQLVAEFRSIRAVVLRLWSTRISSDSEIFRETSRFHEAIDEAITASIARFDEKLGKSRDIILGVLAHDLRNPLHAALISTQYLLRAKDLGDKSTKAAVRVLRSVTRMEELINDLLDYAQTRLGGGLPLNFVHCDMAILCGDVVDEIEAAYPGRSVQSALPVACDGDWDASRIKQMIANLLANAMHHGSMDGPISLTVEAETAQVVIAIHNVGTPISPALQATLFRPVYVEKHRHQDGLNHGSSGLGLGLYIANQIATAHGGDIGLTSGVDEGTTFKIRLPRRRSDSIDGGGTPK